jgi:hypothetical protein
MTLLPRHTFRRPAAKGALVAAGIATGLFLALTFAAPTWPLAPARFGLLIAILTAAGSAVAPERLRLPLLAVSTLVFFG